jgi:hypothetical protein
VVAVVLEHLRKERLSAPTCTFGLGVEKHEPRLLRGNDRVSQLSRPYRSAPSRTSLEHIWSASLLAGSSCTRRFRSA